MSSTPSTNRLRVGMVGMGMIFEETYRPLFERLRREGLYRRAIGEVEVVLAAIATRTGSRAESYRRATGAEFASFREPDAVQQLLVHGVDAVCIATPDDRHYDAARAPFWQASTCSSRSRRCCGCRSWMS